jgi:hypothetical protein
VISAQKLDTKFEKDIKNEITDNLKPFETKNPEEPKIP